MKHRPATIALAVMLIAWITIAPIQAQTSALHFAGLFHEALGNADLILDKNGNLVVSSIGASGQDGVMIHLNQAEGGRVFGVPELMSYWEQTEKGAILTITASGATAPTPKDGGEMTPLFSVIGEDIGNKELEVRADFDAIAADLVTVEVYNQGVLVDSFGNVATSGTIAIIHEDLPVPQRNRTPWWIFAGMAAVVVVSVILVLCGTHVVQIGEPGGPTVIGDEIRIVPEGATIPVESVATIEMRASDTPPVTIAQESLRLFDHEHEVLGNAIFGASGDALVLSNIGASDEDGVLIRIVKDPEAGPEVFDIQLDPVLLADNSATLFVSAVELFDGLPDVELGQVSLSHINGNLEVTTDYTAIGADMVRVEVYDDETLTGTTTVASGVLGDILGTPRLTGCGKVPDLGPADRSGFFLVFEDDFTLVIPGGSGPTELIGDEIRLLAANATALIGTPDSFSLRAGAVTSFTITGESLGISKTIFHNGFESGDTTGWSAVVP